MKAIIKVKAFSGEKSPKAHEVTVEDGVLRVWDDVAGHYTTCHSIRPATARRIMRRLTQRGI